MLKMKSTELTIIFVAIWIGCQQKLSLLRIKLSVINYMCMYNIYKTLTHTHVFLSHPRQREETHGTISTEARQTLTLQQSDHSAQYLFNRKIQMKK